MIRPRGFTIVELLIVIVVIAILAAITTVAFNGIQNRANNTSLLSDLSNAAKQLRLVHAETGAYPTDLPAAVKASSGNVIQLTSSGSPSTFCINGYRGTTVTMSYDSNNQTRSYACNGALIGTPVGGAVPDAPATANLVADFSAWTLSGGVTYDSGSGEIRLSSTSGSAISPLIRVNGANVCRLSMDATATQPSPGYTPSTQAYMGSQYFGDDGTTPAMNLGNYQANGNAATFTPNTTLAYTWNPGCGPNVKYVRFIIHSNPSSRTSDNVYRNPSVRTS